MVNCPDGPRRIDLDTMRRAMTRMLVAGELNDQPMEDLGRQAGMSRSTITRIFSGRAVSLRRLLALLAVLGLAFDTVVAEAVMSAEDPGQG
jgi:transcriptional regulator with XRE-family HTH domain